MVFILKKGLQKIASLAWDFLGWQLEGKLQSRSTIYVIYPHTSNWDFVITILMAFKMELMSRVRWVGKENLFRGPLSSIMRSLGGRPIIRDKSQGAVRKLAQELKAEPNIAFAIAPEGTRARKKHIRSGFYYLAQETGFPCIMVGLDYSRKTIYLSPPFYTTGNTEDDLLQLQKQIGHVKGRYPEDAAPFTFS